MLLNGDSDDTLTTNGHLDANVLMKKWCLKWRELNTFRNLYCHPMNMSQQWRMLQIKTDTLMLMLQKKAKLGFEDESDDDIEYSEEELAIINSVDEARTDI
jgi:hypothetical protein